MAENENTQNLTETPQTEPETTAPAAEQAADSAKPEKPKRNGKPTREEREAERQEARELSDYRKKWENSLVATKRVKREELRRKVKRAMLMLLIFSLITTSVVYVMLLFIEENNIRITASSLEDKSISLSTDQITWTPYLDVRGPENMWNISYNQEYGQGAVPRIAELEETISDTSNVQGGNWSDTNIIKFCFFLKNTCAQDVNFEFEMLLSSNEKGLEDSIRVMWAESYGEQSYLEGRQNLSVKCYAKKSDDERLAYNKYDSNGDGVIDELDEGGVEKIAYPKEDPQVETWNSDQLQKYETNQLLRRATNQYYTAKSDADLVNEGYVDEDGAPSWDSYLENIGYVNTEPFQSEGSVFNSVSTLRRSEILCVYVCIWVEGSDFDCIDTALGGYVTLSINFAVV